MVEAGVGGGGEGEVASVVEEEVVLRVPFPQPELALLVQVAGEGQTGGCEESSQDGFVSRYRGCRGAQLVFICLIGFKISPLG